MCPKGDEMTDKTEHRDSADSPPSGPIRPGSVLYRMLELIAAEIVRKLSANRAVDELPSVGSGPKNKRQEADIS